MLLGNLLAEISALNMRQRDEEITLTNVKLYARVGVFTYTGTGGSRENAFYACVYIINLAAPHWPVHYEALRSLLLYWKQ